MSPRSAVYVCNDEYPLRMGFDVELHSPFAFAIGGCRC